MQHVSQRGNLAPPEGSGNGNANPVPRVDGAIRDVVRQDGGHLRREPESTTQVGTDINLIVQRVAGVALGELRNVISDLQQLHDCLHGEGERVQREISNYVQLSQTAMGSTRFIADNIVHWKEAADSTAHALEKRRAET